MKYLLPFLLSLPAFAADHIVSWSPNPTNEQVSAYVLYEQMGNPPVWSARQTLGGSVTTVTLLSVAPGWHTYSISASNAVGLSAMSQPVSAFVPAFPSPPTNVIIQLRASIESGTTPTQLNNLAQYWLPIVTDRAGCYRTALTADPHLAASVQSGGSPLGPWIDIFSIPLPPENPPFYRATLLATK